MDLSWYAQPLRPTPSLRLHTIATGSQVLCYVWERVPTEQCEAEKKAWLFCTTAHSQWEEDICKEKTERKKVSLTLNSYEQLSSNYYTSYQLCALCNLCDCFCLRTCCVLHSVVYICQFLQLLNVIQPYVCCCNEAPSQVHWLTWCTCEL